MFLTNEYSCKTITPEIWNISHTRKFSPAPLQSVSFPSLPQAATGFISIVLPFLELYINGTIYYIFSCLSSAQLVW